MSVHFKRGLKADDAIEKGTPRVRQGTSMAPPRKCQRTSPNSPVGNESRANTGTGEQELHPFWD